MRHASIVAVAALTVAGFTMVPTTRADTSPTAASTPPAVHMAAAKPIEAVGQQTKTGSPDARIQRTLEDLTQAALTPGDMSKLIATFAGNQRQNITKSTTYSQGYGAKVDTQINSINKTWKQKYGHDFSITKDSGVMSSSFAAIKTSSPGQKSTGMESATVNINSAHATKLEVPLVCEKNTQWRLNVPASLTAEKLRGNLLTELTQLNEQSAHWPAKETDAYRSVSDHVLMAVMDRTAPPAHAQATPAAQPTARAVQSTPAVQVKPTAATSTHHWWKFWD